MRALRDRRLPTIVVVDPDRALEAKWWALPGMPAAITFFTSSLAESINLAASYGTDLLVARVPVEGFPIGDVVRVVRRLNPSVRVAVVIGCDSPHSFPDLDGSGPDFIATESLDPSVLATVFKRLLSESRKVGKDPLCEKGTAHDRHMA